MQYFVKLTILTTAFVFVGTIMAACSASSRSNTIEKAATGNAQNPPNENVSANVKESPKPTKTTETNGLPAFKVGEDYKSNVRVKMLKASWETYHSPDADQCGSGDSTCDEFPEMEACAGTGLGNCKFLWKRAGKLVAIFTVDVPQVFSSYEYEELPKQSSDGELLGKYNYHFTADYGGDISVELQANNAAIYRATSEDSIAEGTGAWSWDEANKSLTVTLPSVKFTLAGDEEKDSKIYKKTLIFQKVGENLKFTGEIPSEEGGQTGGIFKKL